MAAAITKFFGLKAELVEGHSGIFEVRLDDQVIYSNQGSCRRLPTDEEVLVKLLPHARLLPGQQLKITDPFPMA